MNASEIKALIKRLDEAVEKSGWASHLWRFDADWAGLFGIREICNSVLPEGFRLICQDCYGYDKNGKTKSWLFTVEGVDSGERIIDAFASAYAAGRLGSPWSAYDCSISFVSHDYILRYL